VQTVVVEGKVRLERRRVKTIDVEPVRRYAQRFGRKIRAALPDS
jgi:hypothetical protein